MENSPLFVTCNAVVPAGCNLGSPWRGRLGAGAGERRLQWPEAERPRSEGLVLKCGRGGPHRLRPLPGGAVSRSALGFHILEAGGERTEENLGAPRASRLSRASVLCLS